MIFRILILSLLTGSAYAADTVSETGWLKPVPGFTGDVAGAVVTAVNETEQGELIIDISIPADVGEPGNDLPSIEISGKNGKPIHPKKPPDVVQNFEKGAYGVKLRLKKAADVEFRIRLSTD